MVERAADDGSQILEERAEGKVKSLYEDIRLTMRVPTVDLLFRTLAAASPDYLQIAWRALQPNVQTVFFEHRADELRLAAMSSSPPVSVVDVDGDPDFAPTLTLYHYVNPKLYLAAVALRAATNGLEPKLQELRGLEKQQLPRSVAKSFAPPQFVDPGVASEDAEAIAALVGGPARVVPDDIRALARWNSLLPPLRFAVESASTGRDGVVIRRRIFRLAQDISTSLPFRMDLAPHTLRHSGLSEADIDAVRALLSGYVAGFPARLVAVAGLARDTLGAERSRRPLELEEALSPLEAVR